MAVWEAIISIILVLWELFKEWLYIFVSPVNNLEMLWIIIPIWINWFFAEMFQEKEHTSFGNAITNGAVMAWVGIDWIRYLLRMISTEVIVFDVITRLKFIVAFAVAIFGIFIVIQGMKQKQYIRIIGRVRETTYFTVMISPIIYGVVSLTWVTIGTIILFSPLFYLIIELLNHYIPTPEAYRDEMN